MKRNPCVQNGPDGLGWGARIRTWEWRYQKPLPYRLATPHPSGNRHVLLYGDGTDVQHELGEPGGDGKLPYPRMGPKRLITFVPFAVESASTGVYRRHFAIGVLLTRKKAVRQYVRVNRSYETYRDQA